VSILGLSLVLLGNAQVAVAHGLDTPIEGAPSRTGRLTVLWGDGIPGSGTSVTLITVTDDAGQTTPILLSDEQARPYGGILGLNHRRVVVTGSWRAVPALGGQALQVESIELSAPAGPAAASISGEALAVSGPQPWINIACKFSDVATEPKPLSYFNGLVGGTKPGLDDYWREASYNTINIVGSGSVGWYTLPQTRSYYVGLGSSAMLDRLFEDCTGAADSSVFFPAYVGINLMFNSDLDGSAWGGSQWANLDGRTGYWYSTWEPPWGYSNQTVLAHEMGHGFGLPHSSGDYGSTYDNQWDVMSDSWTNCSRSTDPTYGCLGQHTISYHKDRLAWIPGAQKFLTSPGTFTITLEQLALPQTGNYRMARIPIAGSSTHFYTVEVRRWAGYDVKLPGQAVILHEVDTTRLNPAHVVDLDGNGNTGDAGARWEVGETFNDGANGVSVAIDAATGSGFVVTITLGGAATPTATAGTQTPSATGTATSTATSTPTRTNTPSPSATFTQTPSNTSLPSSTYTTTATYTSTPSNTPLPTLTFTATASNTPLPTATFTQTASNTPLPTATFTSTSTNTSIPPTSTYTATAPNTPVPPTWT